MIDLGKCSKAEIELAEKFAKEYHYPDSVAKGIKNEDGSYIEEAEITIRIYLSGFNAGIDYILEKQ